MSPRDRRFSRRIGTRPFSGNRFVRDGMVMIEWRELRDDELVRRTLTLGKNKPATRNRADQILTNAVERARAIAEGLRHVPKPLTLAELLTKYLEDARVRPNPRTNTRISPATIESYAASERALLRGFAGKRSAASLRRGEVREWITEERRRGLAERTIATHIDYFKQVCKWAVEMDLLVGDPLVGLKSPSRVSHTKAYSLEEFHRLLRAIAEQPTSAWRSRLVGYLTALYGVRIHQALQLRWTDVDFDAPYAVGDDVLIGTITWRSESRGAKRQDERTLPLVPIVRDALRVAWKFRAEDSDWIVYCQRNHAEHSPYNSQNLLLRNLEKAAGVTHIKGRAFHGLRRNLATVLIETQSVSVAARWIGDTPAVLLRLYLKPTTQAEQAAVRAVMRVIGYREQQLNGNSEENTEESGFVSDDPESDYEIGAPGFEPGTSCSQSRRATELRHAPLCEGHNNLAPLRSLAKTGSV